MYVRSVPTHRRHGISRAEPEIPCGLYEWRGTIPNATGEFSIRFICPEGEPGIRQFFVEPVLGAWVKKNKKKGRRATPSLQELRSRL